MFIRTTRLMLRPVFPEDWRALYAGICDKGVVRMLARAPWPYTPDHAREYCQRGWGPEALQFAITIPAQDGAPLIGQVGISQTDDDAEYELGYWIARKWQGQGFATEAVRAVLETAAALGVPCVEAGHFLENPASGRVLRKCGFVPTGKVISTKCAARGDMALPAARYCRTLDTSMTKQVA